MSRMIHLNATSSDFDGFYAFAEAQGLKPNQAAAELILTALATHAKDGVYLAASRNLRGELNRMMITEAVIAARQILERIEARAVELGVDITRNG